MAGPGNDITKHPPRWAKWLGLLLPMVFLLAGAGALAGSLIPYKVVKARVDRMASDGNAEGFTEAIYAPAARRARWGGVVLFAYSLGLWALRRRTALFLGGAGRLRRRAVASMRERWAGYWRTAPVWERWGILAVMLAALGVRLFYLRAPLRHDEAFTVEAYAIKPFYRMLTDMRAPNNHMLHSLLAGLSIRLFGDVEWAVRIPALLAGWLSVAVAYLCFRRWAGGAAGLVTAALVASQSAQIEYSVLARGYAMAGLLFLVLLYLVHDWPLHPDSRARWWGFAVCAAAGLCTLFSMVLGLVIAGVWYLIRVREVKAPPWPAIQTMTTASLLAAAGTVLFYLPALLVTGPELLGGIRFAHPMSLARAVAKAFEMFGVLGAYWGEGWPVGMAFSVAVLAAAGLLLHRRIVGGRVPLLAVAIAVCLAFVVLQRLVFFRRVYLFLSPLYLGMAAAAAVWILARLRVPAAGPLLAAAVLVAGMGGVVSTRSVYYSNEIGNARDIQAATAVLRPLVRTGDHVSVTLVSSMPVYYYFRKAGMPIDTLSARKSGTRRLFAIEDKLPVDADGDSSEDVVMSNIELVMRIDGFDTGRLPPPQLLWESPWTRVWLYDRLPR